MRVAWDADTANRVGIAAASKSQLTRKAVGLQPIVWSPLLRQVLSTLTLPAYPMTFFLAACYFIGSLLVLIFLLSMAYRFVKAHERIAEAVEKATRTPSSWPSREAGGPRP